jgi:hypothetical protein
MAACGYVPERGVRYHGPDRLYPGARFQYRAILRRFQGRGNEVTVFDEPRSIGWKLLDPNAYCTRYDLEQAPGGCLLTQTVEYSPGLDPIKRLNYSYMSQIIDQGLDAIATYFHK